MPRALAFAAALGLLAGGCFVAQPCPAPLEACSGTCYDLASDRLHCGACNVVCAAGLVCQSSRCISDPNAACALRGGGAFVTLRACGQSVKAWTTAEPFIARAEALLADPTSPGPAFPLLDVRIESDCDDQWSWHTDPVTPQFVAGAPGIPCDACPSEVELNLASWVNHPWCPGAILHDVAIVAVDRR